MDLSTMVSELKNESISVAKLLRAKENEANQLRDRLHVLESEIQPLADRYDAIKMAIDSLEIVVTSEPVKEEEKPTITEPEKVNAHAGFSRKAKKIGKFDPKGVKMCEYRSINQAANLMGWSNTSVKKYIESTSKEKQIRLRGYYLAYIAA